MKSKISIVALLMLVFLCISHKAYALLSTAKATIIVINEDGKPIEGARAGISFEKNKKVEPGVDITSIDGLTDAQGRFIAQHSNDSNVISYGAEKEGYYYSSGEYRFAERGSLGWKPWNPELNVVLRKIQNQVPMYARNTNESVLEIPIVGKEIGFDLVVFDWVMPYGKGVVPDLLFNLERRVAGRKDFDATITMTFPNKFDGIQLYKENRQYGSQFHLPRFAPESGYGKSLILREWRNPGDGSVKRNFNFLDEDVNYLFRVRSEEKGGKFVKAMYGKISGPIDFSAVHSITAKIYFKYYLNPDYTRNLEFDPKRNLFGTLPDLERVTEP